MSEDYCREEVSQLLAQIERDRALGQRIVFTNGCFDILHIGHIRYLAEAKAMGDRLVIGLNSDASVSRLKGPQRPIIPYVERREMLLALRVVDYVCGYEGDTPLALITALRPDVLVKGGDWALEQIVGHEQVTAYGGRVVSLPYVEGVSTTNIVNAVLAKCHKA